MRYWLTCAPSRIGCSSALPTRAISASGWCLPWQFFPNVQPNSEFANQLEAAGVKREGPGVFLYRYGNRSGAAAIVMAAKGFRRCCNVADGFEGPLDGRKRRGSTGGWKVAGLPGIQD